MPNVTLHLVLADRVLDVWTRSPARAPFEPDDRAAVNAFRQGALGPDIGYFPGSDPFLSDLAHYVRSGDLTRALVGAARNSRERAYAWGWATHVVADAEIHPLVGEAVGHLLQGRRGRFVGISDDRTSHVRVEVGLDAAYAARHPGQRVRTGEPVFNRDTISYLGRAYRETYALEVDPALLMASHATATRMANRALGAIGVLGTAQAAEEAVPVRGARWALEQALAVVREGLDQESMLLAFLNPVRPVDWLLDEVDEISEGFPDRFGRVYPDGIDELPNYNLDTGRIEVEGAGTLCARRAVRRLEDLVGVGFSPDGNGRRPARYPGGGNGPGCG